MKNILSIIVAVLCFGVISTSVNAGAVTLRDPEGDGAKNKVTPIQEHRKQVQPPAKPKPPVRLEVRPLLKKTESFKPLPSDERKKMKDDLDP